MKHYQQWRRTGSPDTMTLYERLMKRVQWEGDCLIDPETNGGYTYLRSSGRTATHAVLEHHGYPRPDGAEALHSCDRPGCVNIEHLRWGTHAENMAEMKARKRARCSRRKLSDEDIESIRADDRPRRIIAEQYDIHVNTVGQIKLHTHGYA